MTQLVCILVMIMVQTTFALGSPLNEAKKRCLPEEPTDQILYRDEFNGTSNLNQMEVLFQKVYYSGKRLKHRAFYDESADQFVVPLTDEENIVINNRHLISTIKHIEEALDKEYAQFLFFPDMGHSHFLIPEDDFKNEISKAVGKKATYEAILDNPEVKVFYHTAEKLKMKDQDQNLLSDPWLLWRYFTRNIAGDTKEHGHLEIHKNLNATYNTVHTVPGFFWYGAGFQLSASSSGCFPYEHDGKTYYFDLSLTSLAPKSPGFGI